MNINLGAVPTSFGVVAGEMADGTPAVILTATTPIGLAGYFMDREAALAVAAQLRRVARGGGLIEADGGLVVPDGAGG